MLMVQTWSQTRLRQRHCSRCLFIYLFVVAVVAVVVVVGGGGVHVVVGGVVVGVDVVFY